MRNRLPHIICLLCLSVVCLTVAAQQPQSQPNTEPLMPGETPKPTKYVEVQEEKEHLVFFQGFTLSVDVFGPVLYTLGDYGSAEAALRLNLKNTYFPIVELGYGKCSTEDINTMIKYKAAAPYARIGCDINMLKDKFQDNRLYIGARYGVSRFSYDLSGPPMQDPIWNGKQDFNIDNINCTSHWGEFLFGAEVKIYKNFHMGWSVRYRHEFSSTKSDFSKPNCVPGYGYTTKKSNWGGTYNLIFDLNWGKKKGRKAGVSVNIRDVEPTTTDGNGADMNKDDKTTEEDGNGTENNVRDTNAEEQL